MDKGLVPEVPLRPGLEASSLLDQSLCDCFAGVQDYLHTQRVSQPLNRIPDMQCTCHFFASQNYPKHASILLCPLAKCLSMPISNLYLLLDGSQCSSVGPGHTHIEEVAEQRNAPWSWESEAGLGVAEKTPKRGGEHQNGNTERNVFGTQCAFCISYEGCSRQPCLVHFGK